jgi:hypothetical protein
MGRLQTAKNNWRKTGKPEAAGQLPVDIRKKLFSLLMTILSQSFFTLVRRNLMTLSFLTTRHSTFNFFDE